MDLFDPLAEDYDAARPEYPAALYGLLDELGGGLAGTHIADGGAGTGLATRELVARGARVTAFDTGPGMLRRAAMQTPGLIVAAADAAALCFRPRSFDMVCFAQSWHWVEQKRGASEAARVLRPGGWWAAWWNHPWADGEEWFERYFELLESRCAVSRHQRDTDWCSRAVAANRAFEPPERHIISWERNVTVDLWMVDQRTHSYVIGMPESERAELLHDAESILRDHFSDGRMTVPYRTRTWVARRNHLPAG